MIGGKIESITINGKTFSAEGTSGSLKGFESDADARARHVGIMCDDCISTISKTDAKGRCQRCAKPSPAPEFNLCADCSSFCEVCTVCTNHVDLDTAWMFADD